MRPTRSLLLSAFVVAAATRFSANAAGWNVFSSVVADVENSPEPDAMSVTSSAEDPLHEDESTDDEQNDDASKKLFGKVEYTAADIEKKLPDEYTYYFDTINRFPGGGLNNNERYLDHPAVSQVLEHVEKTLEAAGRKGLLEIPPKDKMMHPEVVYCRNPVLEKGLPYKLHKFHKFDTDMTFNLTEDRCTVSSTGYSQLRKDDSPWMSSRGPFYCSKFRDEEACDYSSDFVMYDDEHSMIAFNGRYALRKHDNQIDVLCKETRRKLVILFATFDIGNAGFGYVPYTTLSNREIVAELVYGEVLTYEAGGLTPSIALLPFGDYDERVLAIVGALGYQYFDIDDGKSRTIPGMHTVRTTTLMSNHSLKVTTQYRDRNAAEKTISYHMPLMLTALSFATTILFL